MSKGATAACDIIGFFLPRSANFEWAIVMWLMWWQSMAVIRIIDSGWCAEQGVQAPFFGDIKGVPAEGSKEQWRCTQICRTFFLFPINVDLTITKSQFEVVNAAALLPQEYSNDTCKRVAVSSMYFLKRKTWQMKHEGRLRQYRAFNPASAFAVITYVSVLWNISLSSSSASKLWALVAYDLPIANHKCSGEVLKGASNDSMWVNNGAIVKWSLVEGADQCLSMWKLIGSDQVDPHWIPRYERLITGGRPAVVTVAMHWFTLVLYHSYHCLPFIGDTYKYHWLSLLLIVLVYHCRDFWFFCWEIVIAELCSLSTR